MSSAERCVRVSLAERSYDILIEAGLLREVGARLRELGLAGKVAVVTNPVVAKLYAPAVLRSLKAAGYQTRMIVVPEGERAKSLRWVSAILDELVRARFERGSVLLALGGGVVGDLAGFAASIFVRGIPFVQVPTTLVSQVDSSVGGKTGVNHPLGKNLIGAFHQPRLVLIDPDTLGTLPARERVAGLAEVIKYGMIEDEKFFAYLERRMADLLKLESDAVIHAITRSCEIKASVVAEDERESDRRRVLNYGHTVGHALESLGRYRTLIHGEAVAIGMVQEAGLAGELGLCPPEVVIRQRELVRQAGLPDRLPPVRFTELWNTMQHDKKVAQGRLYCVLPERIGRVVIAPLERATVKQWFAQQGRQGGGTGRRAGAALPRRG
ncbi:MAG: 3-dehydroquinate synthase [Nitrospirae bacterium]|nr:3-dehydroquinate synthase [Nitrospirota bacterium]